MDFINKINEFFFGANEEEFEDEDFITREPKLDPDYKTFAQQSKKSKIVNINATTQLQVVVTQPENFDEAKSIADNLKTKKPVVINLESLDKEVSRRVVDFISGAVYALDGNIQKVSTGIFLVTPYNIGIMSNLKDELKEKGVFPFNF